MEFGVLAVEVVLQALEVAGTFPVAHGQVVEEVVAAGFRAGGRYLLLSENPLEAFDGQLAHVLHGVGAGHDDVHAGEASHGSDVDHIVLGARVAEPCGHEVFQTVHGGRRHGGFLVGLRDAEVEGGEAPVLTRDVDAGLQAGVVDGETLYDFHKAVV